MKQMESVKRKIIQAMQLHDFGHDGEDGSFHTTYYKTDLLEQCAERATDSIQVEDFWQSPGNLPTVTDESGMPILVVVKEGGLGTRTDECGNKVREDAVVTGVILPSGRIRANGFSGNWVFTKWMPLPKP